MRLRKTNFFVQNKRDNNSNYDGSGGRDLDATCWSFRAIAW